MNESIIIGAAARDAWRGEKARGIVGGGSDNSGENHINLLERERKRDRKREKGGPGASYH